MGSGFEQSERESVQDIRERERDIQSVREELTEHERERDTQEKEKNLERERESER